MNQVKLGYLESSSLAQIYLKFDTLSVIPKDPLINKSKVPSH